MSVSRLLLSLLIVSGCAASPREPSGPWRVEVVTSGGLTGRGMGTFTAGSDGKAAVTMTDGRECTFSLTADELSRIEKALPEKRSAWRSSYIPENPCCDRFQFDLTVEQEGLVTKTTWIDDPLPMPARLQALADAMTGGEKSIRVLANERCP